MRYVASIDKIPNGSFYMALEQSSYTSPGYDPGDSPSTNDCLRVIIFANDEEMKKWVAEKQSPKYGIPSAYKILYVRVPVITTKIDVGILLPES